MTLVSAAINLGSATNTTKCKSGFVTEQNPVRVGMPPDKMTSFPLHPDKRVTSCYYRAILRATRTDGLLFIRKWLRIVWTGTCNPLRWAVTVSCKNSLT